MILGLLIALLIAAFDQASKYFMMNNILADGPVVEITSFFNLVKAWNTGVSFSMFDSYGALGVVILSAIAIFVVAYLVWWLKGEPRKLIQVSIGFIIGGAIGNVIDRVRLGAVFDFLDFHIATQHWPAFNLADSFICLGAFIIIIDSFFKHKK